MEYRQYVECSKFSTWSLHHSLSELIFSSSFSTVIYHLLLDWWTPPAFTFMHHAARTMHSMLRVFYENWIKTFICYLSFKEKIPNNLICSELCFFTLKDFFFSNMCGLLRIYEFWLEVILQAERKWILM